MIKGLTVHSEDEHLESLIHDVPVSETSRSSRSRWCLGTGEGFGLNSLLLDVIYVKPGVDDFALWNKFRNIAFEEFLLCLRQVAWALVP